MSVRLFFIYRIRVFTTKLELHTTRRCDSVGVYHLYGHVFNFKFILIYLLRAQIYNVKCAISLRLEVHLSANNIPIIYRCAHVRFERSFCYYYCTRTRRPSRPVRSAGSLL